MGTKPKQEQHKLPFSKFSLWQVMIGTSKKIGEASARRALITATDADARCFGARAQVADLDLRQRSTLGTCLRMWARKCPGSLTFLKCPPKLLFARGTPTCLQHLWAKSLKTLWPFPTYSRPRTFIFQHKSEILGAGFCNWGLWKISISWQEGGKCIADLYTQLTRCPFWLFVSFPVAKGRKVAKHQHSSSTLEPARYET